jgi:hypothetical protein
MPWVEVRTFITADGGNEKGNCLKNTREGYRIPAKYPTAWDAWQHTQQHASAIPRGVDVPLFFSYKNTINGVYKNWGHIGVQLQNGKFWSDGKIYANVNEYLAGHPKVHYVGWGESINDVRVLKYVAEPVPATPKMPKVGSLVTLLAPVDRTTFKNGTVTVAGHLRFKTNQSYVVRGYDKKYKGRILINSASGGGNGVALALYYTNGQRIPGWK